MGMQDKIESLKYTLSQHPPDAKLLQMQLQGGIATSVNQGPFYIAQSFLDIPPDQHGYHHRRLKVCFKEFTKRYQLLITSALMILASAVHFLCSA